VSTSSYNYTSTTSNRYESRALRESERSNKEEENVGRHNIMTFMPKDRENNMLEVEKELQNESPAKESNKESEAFDVADMEKNLVKFEESRAKKPDSSNSYHHQVTTTIETRTESNGNGETVTRKKYERSYRDQDDPYTKYESKY